MYEKPNKLNREQIIKALECLTGEEVMFCRECAYNTVGAFSCKKELAKDALSLIKEFTEQVEKDNKTIIDLYHEAETYLAQRDCLRNQVKNLTEENERLRAENEALAISEVKECEISQMLVYRIRNKHPAVMAVIADTVRKMQTEIESRCRKGGIYPAFVKSTIDQIAKEMLEGEK